jgi:hypothetical protein
MSKFIFDFKTVRATANSEEIFEILFLFNKPAILKKRSINALRTIYIH